MEKPKGFSPRDVIKVDGVDCLVADSARNLSVMSQLVQDGAAPATLEKGTVSLLRVEGDGHPPVVVSYQRLLEQVR